MDESLRCGTIALMTSSEALIKHAQRSQLSVLYGFVFFFPNILSTLLLLDKPRWMWVFYYYNLKDHTSYL